MVPLGTPRAKTAPAGRYHLQRMKGDSLRWITDGARERSSGLLWKGLPSGPWILTSKYLRLSSCGAAEMPGAGSATRRSVSCDEETQVLVRVVRYRVGECEVVWLAER